ncbi:MAG: metallo-dependent hydrolase [Rhodobacteraceae bacterium]|nr:MAG: metallo-dependent hydrolase [Paracoccaceae bacterium]
MQVDGPHLFNSWRRAMKRMAEVPNVACKIFGLGMVDWNWTPESIRPYVEGAIEAFGTNCCMFASNFPVDKRFSSCDAIFNAITAGYSTHERTALFHDNAARLYRL